MTCKAKSVHYEKFQEIILCSKSQIKHYIEHRTKYEFLVLKWFTVKKKKHKSLFHILLSLFTEWETVTNISPFFNNNSD